MKLYVLRRNPSYDEAGGFVVRASSAKRARELAAEQCGDEGMGVWLNPEDSTCRQLKEDGRSEVILRDYYGA